MSETIFKFFPLDPRRRFKEEELTGIKVFLLEENGASIIADSIETQEYDGIQFIDCGTWLERIRCPKCGDEIPMELWQNAMDADYLEESRFQLKETVSCQCAFESRLHGLNYEAPCGFACACLSVKVASHFWTGWLRHYPWIGSVEARY